MSKIVWAPGVLNDIDAIAECISRDSIYHASLFIDRLCEAAELAKLHLLSDRIIPEIGNPNCREIIYGSYCIMYWIEKTAVSITGVIHGARNWKPPRV